MNAEVLVPHPTDSAVEMEDLTMKDVDFIDAYLDRVSLAVESIDRIALSRFAGAIDEVVSNGGQVLCMGNGGSAAAATHFVNDLVMAYARTGRVVRASSLTDNHALVTGGIVKTCGSACHATC